MPGVVAEPTAVLSEMLGGYLLAAKFTDCGEPGEPDHGATYSAAAILRAMADCARFLHLAGPGLLLAYATANEAPDDSGEGDARRLGHDLWLTRNGHGAGFWDRDELQTEGVYQGKAWTLGDCLSDIARQLGACDLVAGDDGLLYLEGGA
jgi:hypothetical protein